MCLVNRALAPWTSSQESHETVEESVLNLSSQKVVRASQRLKTGVEMDEICLQPD